MNGTVIVENRMVIPEQIKNKIDMWSSHPLLGIYPKELQQHCEEIFVHPGSQ